MSAPGRQLLTLWVGAELSFLERACLRSALAHGHEVALYCYAPPRGVPTGVEVRDAAAILPEAEIIRYPNGSPALFANRFRYELLHRALGTWIDCDVYFIAPLRDSEDYLMGDQGGGTINTALLRLPAASPVLADLRALFCERVVPPWLPWRSRLAARARRLRTGRSGVARMPWGSTGPEALTWLARRHGLTDRVLPATRFYPVHWTAAEWVCTPDLALDDMIAPDTIAVHLWHGRLGSHAISSAPQGSFAARLREEGRL